MAAQASGLHALLREKAEGTGGPRQVRVLESGILPRFPALLPVLENFSLPCPCTLTTFDPSVPAKL